MESKSFIVKVPERYEAEFKAFLEERSFRLKWLQKSGPMPGVTTNIKPIVYNDPKVIDFISKKHEYQCTKSK